MEKIKTNYAKYYHKGSIKLARKDFEQYHSEFIKFTNETVDEHSTIYMCDWTVGKLINEYFYWTKEYSKNWENAPSAKIVLGFKSKFYASVINGPIGETTEFGRNLTPEELEERKKKIESQKNLKKTS